MTGANHLDIDKMFGISLKGDPRFEYLRQKGCFKLLNTLSTTTIKSAGHPVYAVLSDG